MLTGNNSGNGIQALWLLSTPVTVPEGERVNRALAAQLGADSSTYNADRILRLPGTRNLPTRKKREKGRTECDATLIRFDDSAYAIEVFEAYREPANEKRGQVGGQEAPVDLEHIVRTGDASRWKGDRSKAVWNVTCELVRCGEPHDQIARMLLDPANGISAHIYDQTNPKEYARRQVEKAAREVEMQARDAPLAYPEVEYLTVVRGGSSDAALWTFRFAGGAEITISSDDVSNQPVFRAANLRRARQVVRAPPEQGIHRVG